MLASCRVLIVLDLMLPNRDGTEVCRALRERARRRGRDAGARGAAIDPG